MAWISEAKKHYEEYVERWVQDYIDGNDNGYAPDVFVTGIENIRIVLNDVAIRKAITGYSDKLLTLDELNTFLRGRELPPMEAFDASLIQILSARPMRLRYSSSTLIRW